MIDPVRIVTGIPMQTQVLIAGVLVFIAGMIVGAGITVLIWGPP